MPLPLTINRLALQVKAEGDTPLLWVLRGELQLRGTKFGCGIGQCGACTVQVNGQPVRSCSLPLQSVSGEVTTIEGLQGPEIDALRQAWTELDVVQCGYCQSGQLVAAAALLVRTPAPTEADIHGALNGNLCRCGTYPRIQAAILLAARLLSGGTPAVPAAGPGAAAKRPGRATSDRR